jgi:hypothetical protein
MSDFKMNSLVQLRETRKLAW